MKTTKNDLLHQLDKLKIMVENHFLNEEEPNIDFMKGFERVLLEKYLLTIEELREENRKPTMAMLRQLYCYGLRKYKGYSLNQLSAVVGYTNHTTAIYSLRKIESMLQVKDAMFMEMYKNFEHLFI